MNDTQKPSQWNAYKQLKAWDNEVDAIDEGKAERDEIETESVDVGVVRRKVALDRSSLTQELGIVSVDELFEPTVEIADFRDVLGSNLFGNDDW
ncbi:MAG: hypothetical protein ACFCUJ_04525 [Thiotrichales bacterium]